MSYVITSMRPASQVYLDDEIAALALQLEEINCHSENSKGKYPEERPPDSEVAFSSFQAEIQAHISFLNDLKLAHSIAQAVDTDGQVIAAITGEEADARQDRQLALQVNECGNSDTEPPPPYSQVDDSNLAHEERLSWFSNINDTFENEDDAGPSTAYTRHQENAIHTLSQAKHQCSVCLDNFRRWEVFPLQCGDIYCRVCLKTLFMRATKDESLFPPRCCRQKIPLTLIAKDMTANEIEVFKSSEMEFSTVDRTYCSNVDCGKFIPPTQIRAGRAECGYCDSLTCAMCKNAFHLEDCPADPALQETLTLARAQGWQRCYRCGAIVQLNKGCFHITYGTSFFVSTHRRH
ncbi:hypothetical protein VTO42DRAFT_576 [Malbranchea cinnamomea]